MYLIQVESLHLNRSATFQILQPRNMFVYRDFCVYTIQTICVYHLLLESMLRQRLNLHTDKEERDCIKFDFNRFTRFIMYFIEFMILLYDLYYSIIEKKILNSERFS